MNAVVRSRTLLAKTSDSLFDAMHTAWTHGCGRFASCQNSLEVLAAKERHLETKLAVALDPWSHHAEHTLAARRPPLLAARAPED